LRKPYKDLTDKDFGRWKVIGEPIYKNGRYYWKCECNCDNHTIRYVSGSSLTTGNSTSCGCITIENIKLANKRYNTYHLTKECGIGYTSKREEFYFDIEDYNRIKYHCWFTNDAGYIVTNLNGRIERLHRFLLMCSPHDGVEIDHKNRIKYDNRKDNLRICNHSENMKNRDKQINNSSGIKGIWFDKDRNKWCADIQVNYKMVHLGRFNNLDEAIKIRNEADVKYFGEFSYLLN